MTLFEALPTDIGAALYHYCNDDECLNDAMLRALRNELKIDQVEHNKHSHDCFRCDMLKSLKQENEVLKKANEIIAQQRDGRDADISMLENRIEELERDKKDLIFVRNQTAKCMCEDKERLAKAKEIIKGLLELGSIGDGDYTYVRDAEQFLKEQE